MDADRPTLSTDIMRYQLFLLSSDAGPGRLPSLAPSSRLASISSQTCRPSFSSLTSDGGTL